VVAEHGDPLCAVLEGFVNVLSDGTWPSTRFSSGIGIKNTANTILSDAGEMFKVTSAHQLTKTR